MKQSALHKLDIVLRQLSQYTIPQNITTIEQGLSNKFKETELRIILSKLIKDKYAEYEVRTDMMGSFANLEDIPPHLLAYKISFDGIIFLDLVGGYVKQGELNRAESIRLENLETAQRESRNQMNFLTKLIAVGTLVAAIYYSIQIYQIAHSFLNAHGHYWQWEQIPKPKKT